MVTKQWQQQQQQDPEQQREQQQQPQQQQRHLPHEVLVLVMQRIQQHERLRCCSLVCGAWRAAAAAATTGITVERVTAVNHSSLTLWLSAHGGHLTDMSLRAVSDSREELLYLPYSQLTQLRSCYLADLLVHPHPEAAAVAASGSSSSSSSNPLRLLTNLNSLTLIRVTLCGVPGGLDSLSALSALQDLCIGTKVVFTGLKMQRHSSQLVLPAAGPPEQVSANEHLCLQQLTQLKRIEACICYFPKGCVAPLSALQQLQHLQLDGRVTPSQAGLFVDLPASLTHLGFDWRCEHDLTIHSVPAVASLTALRTLWVTGDEAGEDVGSCSPLLLTRMQQLQVLHLHQLTTDELPELLQVMPQLSSLRQLDLRCADVKALPASEAARYSDLLPSAAHLSKVVLRDVDAMLPDAGYGCHIFPPGRQLPSLTHLTLGGEPGEDLFEPADLPPPSLDDLGIFCMAACCPALEELLLPGCLIKGVQLAPLTQLTALTQLLLAGDQVDDEFAAEQLARLTGLKHVYVWASCLTDAGVAQLTALTRLSSLQIFGCELSPGLSDEESLLQLNNKPSGETVAQLLAERCTRAAAMQALESGDEVEGGSDVTSDDDRW